MLHGLPHLADGSAAAAGNFAAFIAGTRHVLRGVCRLRNRA